MKSAITTTLLLSLTLSHAMERGRDFMRDKICNEYNTLGVDYFRYGLIILNTKKYSNATFEEITNIVNAIVDLAKKCCTKGADPNCYENGSLAIATKSCEQNTNFPKHPGIADCCTQQGLARKLCLAALKHPSKEFPSYVEPSNEEMCESFRRNPQAYAARYLYNYCRDYSNAPISLLSAYTSKHLSMVAKCCLSQTPTLCFVDEKTQKARLSILTTLANKACARYDLFEREKNKLSFLIKYTQRTPRASFEDIVSLAEGAVNMLPTCCNSTNKDCFGEKFETLTTQLCNTLSVHDPSVAGCCREIKDFAMKTTCLYRLPRAPAPTLPEVQEPPIAELCGARGQHKLEKYIYEIARRYTYSPEAIVTTLYEMLQSTMRSCCPVTDLSTCYKQQMQGKQQNIYVMLARGYELCEGYAKHPFLKFKEKLKEGYSSYNLTQALLSKLVEQRVNFASKCCSLNSPPSFCGLQVSTPPSCAENYCLPS